jgi:ABC-type uncharacterized transport system permease subunit
LFAALAVLLFVIFGHSGRSVFSFTASNKGAVTLPTWTLSVRVAGAIVTVIAVVMAALSAVLVARRISVPIWYVALYALAVTVGFLAWATTHHTVPITGLLVQSLALSTPLIFGALGGVISERVGVVNVAIEGQLLAGAFVSAVVASLTGSVIAGIVAAMAAGMLVSFVLATFAIKYAVNQIIVGIVLNGLVLALTTFLYQTVLVNDADTANSPPQLHAEAIPLLNKIPIIGPLLFDQTAIVYLMYVAVAAVYIGLFRTRWGLRVRAVGEHPQAADTVGINVARTRFWNVALAGAIVGMGGAYFTLGNVGAFTQNVTSGAGYIALAAVIFGRWDPLRASMAALLFGFANELQFLLNGLGSPVPSDILLMLPYLVTIFAVAGLVGSVRGPAAAGRPYLKS